MTSDAEDRHPGYLVNVERRHGRRDTLVTPAASTIEEHCSRGSWARKAQNCCGAVQQQQAHQTGSLLKVILNEQANQPSRIDTDALERETGFGWGWFIVLGGALIVLGALAFLNLPPAGTVSVYAVGVVMVIGASHSSGPRFGPKLERDWPRGPERDLVRRGWHFSDRQSKACCDAADSTAGFRTDLLRSNAHSVDFGMPPLAGWGWVAASGFVTVLCWPHIHPLVVHQYDLAAWHGTRSRPDFSGRNGNRIRRRSQGEPTAIPPSMT